jgi:hypothetical protein
MQPNDKVFWDDVRHWNRENCGWTMGRQQRFVKKVDRDLTAPNPAASFAYLDEASGKEKEAELQRQNHRYRATYQEGSPPKKHESMPWLKDRNLGPGDYEHRDPWEVEQTCGFVPASSMFKSESKRDLYLNEGFHKTRLGKLVGPQTPARKVPEIEKVRRERGKEPRPRQAAALLRQKQASGMARTSLKRPSEASLKTTMWWWWWWCRRAVAGKRDGPSEASLKTTMWWWWWWWWWCRCCRCSSAAVAGKREGWRGPERSEREEQMWRRRCLCSHENHIQDDPHQCEMFQIVLGRSRTMGNVSDRPGATRCRCCCRCSSAAEASKREGCRGETPTNPGAHVLGHTRARPHTCSATHVLGHTWR